MDTSTLLQQLKLEIQSNINMAPLLSSTDRRPFDRLLVPMCSILGSIATKPLSAKDSRALLTDFLQQFLNLQQNPVTTLVDPLHVCFVKLFAAAADAALPSITTSQEISNKKKVQQREVTAAIRAAPPALQPRRSESSVVTSASSSSSHFKIEEDIEEEELEEEEEGDEIEGARRDGRAADGRGQLPQQRLSSSVVVRGLPIKQQARVLNAGSAASPSEWEQEICGGRSHLAEAFRGVPPRDANTDDNSGQVSPLAFFCAELHCLGRFLSQRELDTHVSTEHPDSRLQHYETDGQPQLSEAHDNESPQNQAGPSIKAEISFADPPSLASVPGWIHEQIDDAETPSSSRAHTRVNHINRDTGIFEKAECLQERFPDNLKQAKSDMLNERLRSSSLAAIFGDKRGLELLARLERDPDFRLHNNDKDRCYAKRRITNFLLHNCTRQLHPEASETRSFVIHLFRNYPTVDVRAFVGSPSACMELHIRQVQQRLKRNGLFTPRQYNKKAPRLATWMKLKNCACSDADRTWALNDRLRACTLPHIIAGGKNSVNYAERFNNPDYRLHEDYHARGFVSRRLAKYLMANCNRPNYPNPMEVRQFVYRMLKPYESQVDIGFFISTHAGAVERYVRRQRSRLGKEGMISVRKYTRREPIDD